MTEHDSSYPKPLPEPSPVEHGGRVELRLDLDGFSPEAEVVYQARWFTPEGALEGSVSVDRREKVMVSIQAPDGLPEWLASFTSNLVSTTARKVTQEDEWPRRLTRWRDAPKKS